MLCYELTNNNKETKLVTLFMFTQIKRAFYGVRIMVTIKLLRMCIDTLLLGFNIMIYFVNMQQHHAFYGINLSGNIEIIAVIIK